ncbi:redox-regulated ATPase YchF [Candidatus Woesebacteria bacterium RIFCSPLOWO2_01_FULL_39_23]|uniref:Ribosome-binding ATPase YchF n=1 Tax=Candidatus Woesebacteria bacterium RIFCSPHIGHO2_01_FULL_40_22 TaxID=1802499 RepID=A0A1F7YIY8_9BACT|nr:MAG: redox-regulated ATPase YchF [Candidatus Woesebacteria bacterium RBG_16_40_11]OGM27311.1 MAG: redox-regulated ATPase YchF [Candidatus Woesebacteria bacterium RIFCSPHIGHO2_01_FULL_40_22]OGM36989.1 MAG: redox-regulated ATPase YchF [Candidatus Woesebacteria bacterium RIFCSPHIGHO2_12_FULL_38_9]OGM62483.1 MAG: redox-regulated ATPase YchF [Candidatus Woesebacteria bacterium RIFCSPLOWO2_01_FULL_39_23]
MSSLSCGIVGLPNVGKSTLFNALLKRQASFAEASEGQAGLAKVANFPFTTIEPNIGVVPVPDSRLDKLAVVVANSFTSEVKDVHTSEVSKKPPIVPATVEFLDIAGLIAGAHKGEGLGNKFLSHIREVSAVCHVVRVFTDPDIIKEGSINPKSDLETVETELKLADLQTLEKQKDPGNTPNKELVKWWEVVTKLRVALQEGVAAREVELNEEETKIAKQLSLLTSKPILICLNVDENDLKDANKLELKFAEDLGVHASQVIAISAKVESELSALDEGDQKNYLEDLGVKESGLERLINKAFETLGLITYLTAGEKEVRAWTIRLGSTSLTAAGEIHTDFIKNFIKADVVDFDKFIDSGGWKNAREAGFVRSEGKKYVVKDGDVIEFKIGT